MLVKYKLSALITSAFVILRLLCKKRRKKSTIAFGETRNRYQLLRVRGIYHVRRGSQEADSGWRRQTSGKKTLKMREVLQINCNALEGVKEKGPRVFPIIFSTKKRENERIRLPILLLRILQKQHSPLFTTFSF